MTEMAAPADQRRSQGPARRSASGLDRAAGSRHISRRPPGRSASGLDRAAARIYDWSSLDPFLKDIGLELGASQCRQMESYLDMVSCHNLKSGLTADAAPRTLLLRHAADALAAGPVIRSLGGPAARLADVGSGAGFIGLALKIALPDLDVTLIEPLKRRFDFLNLAALALGLKGLHLMRRFDRDSGRGPFDAAIERALAPLPRAAELAAPLIGPRGFFIAYQSAPLDGGTPLGRGAPFTVKKSVSYRLPLESRTRYLVVSQRS